MTNKKKRKITRTQINKDEIMPVHPIVDWDKIYHKKTIQLEFTVRKGATPEEIEQAYMGAIEKFWKQVEAEERNSEQEVRRLVLELVNSKGGDAMQEDTPIFHGDCCQ